MLFALGHCLLVALAALVFRLSGKFLHFCSSGLLLTPTFFEALVSKMLDQGNGNPVSGADIVQKKIAVGMYGAILKQVGMQAGTSRAGRALACNDRVNVTNRATDLGENLRAAFRLGSGSHG